MCEGCYLVTIEIASPAPYVKVRGRNDKRGNAALLTKAENSI
jgi:hypothetical protein